MPASPKPPPTKRRTTKRKSPTTVSPLITSLTTALTSSYTFLHSNDLHLLPSQSLSLQSTLSSAFLSLSKLQPQLHLSLSSSTTSSSSSCWFHRLLLSSSSSDPRWAHFFRMSKPTFLLLTSTLSNSLSSALPSSIPPDYALGAALFKLAHNGSFSFVGKRFGLSSTVACRVFYTVCKLICDEMGGYLCGFGSGSGGFDRFSLVNCNGVLGVEKFPVEGEVLGKDGFLMVQALVDGDGRFVDVSAGWPSTFDPVSILRLTRLFSSMEESKELLIGPKVEINDGNLMPQYVLGDSCYPCLPWLLTPFVGSGEGKGSSSGEKVYNEVHKSAMGLVRVAFGRVRGNWKLLDKRWKEEFVEFLPFIIITACVLNNFLIKHGEPVSDDDSGCVREMDMPVYDGKVDESAARIRDLLAMHLSRTKAHVKASSPEAAFQSGYWAM